jgi:exonuclease VII large subunit
MKGDIMLSKGTYQFVMSKIQSANNGELLAIKDQLRELLRHPISVDAELMRDTKKTLEKN